MGFDEPLPSGSDTDSEQLIEAGAYEGWSVNEIIYERTKDRSLADVRSDLGRAQQELLAALAGLTDADLQRTYSHYQPDEPGEDSGAPVLEWIAGNSYEHYEEHLEWIEALVG
jgi:hypothetical protein